MKKSEMILGLKYIVQTSQSFTKVKVRQALKYEGTSTNGRAALMSSADYVWQSGEMREVKRFHTIPYRCVLFLEGEIQGPPTPQGVLFDEIERMP